MYKIPERSRNKDRLDGQGVIDSKVGMGLLTVSSL